MEARSSRRMRTLVTRMAALGHFRPTLRVSAAVRFCSSPKATYLLRDNEMTRKGQAGLPLQGFGDGPGSRPPDIVCHRASLYKAGANGTFPSAWLREVAAPAGKNGLALGKAEEL